MCAKTAETGARGQRGLILMQFVYCGFVDADTPFASNLQLTSLYDTAHVLQAVPGGWGYVLLIADSCSCPGKRVLHDVTAAGQISGQLPDGSVQKAALGWKLILAVSHAGQLYSSALPDLHDSLTTACYAWKLLTPPQQAVQQVAAGEHHSAALTQDGTVYTWGSNDSCQLGRQLPPGNIHDETPTPVAGPGVRPPEGAKLAASQNLPELLNNPGQQMRSIACGARHSCCVSCSGQVFCWGWDLHGQCGQGQSTVTVDQPQLVKVLGGLQVVGVAAGLAHTVAYTDSGAVFAWGWNSDGQLGLGHDRNRSQPELLDAAVLEDVDVDKVCCGARHTVVKSSKGDLLSWGWNKYGQLGLGDTNTRLLPNHIAVAACVKDVECGWWHTVVVYDAAPPQA